VDDAAKDEGFDRNPGVFGIQNSRQTIAGNTHPSPVPALQFKKPLKDCYYNAK
jgi:hypothetical protein